MEWLDKILNNGATLYGSYLESKRPVATAAPAATESKLPSWAIPAALVVGLVVVVMVFVKR